MRRVSDISHEYYDVIDSVMNLIRSFCEGGNSEILDQISEVIQAEKIYDRMQHLIRLLYHTTKPNFAKNKLIKEQNLKLMGLSELNTVLKGKELKEVVTDQVCNQMMGDESSSVSDFKYLLNTYISNTAFSGHFCLQIATKIFFLMQDISERSEIYKKLLLERKAAIKIKNRQRRAVYASKAIQEVDAIHEFIWNVTASVEIQNQENKLIVS